MLIYVWSSKGRKEDCDICGAEFAGNKQDVLAAILTL